jgi:hypothetical protein
MGVCTRCTYSQAAQSLPTHCVLLTTHLSTTHCWHRRHHIAAAILHPTNATGIKQADVQPLGLTYIPYIDDAGL